MVGIILAVRPVTEVPPEIPVRGYVVVIPEEDVATAFAPLG